MSARGKLLVKLALAERADDTVPNNEDSCCQEAEEDVCSIIYDTDNETDSTPTNELSIEAGDKETTLMHTFTNKYLGSKKANTTSDVYNTPENSRAVKGGLNQFCEIYDFSEISPEIEIQKQIVCQINKDCCIEKVVPMCLNFDTGLLIKHMENEEQINDNVSWGQAYMDNNTVTNVCEGDIIASREEEYINIDKVKNCGETYARSNGEISVDDNRDRDFDIYSFREDTDTNSYRSSCDAELSESSNTRPSNNDNTKSISTQQLSEQLNINTNSYENSCEAEFSEFSNIRPSNNDNSKSISSQQLSEQLKTQQKNYHYKKVHCKFCGEDISSRNFVRHLLRHHNNEKEVKDVLDFPVKSKQRKQALELLKGRTNFELYLKGIIRPKKQRTEVDNVEYYPCIYCKTLYSKSYLHRHAKICPVGKKSTESNKKFKQIPLSQTLVACALDATDAISKLNIKEQVFDMMRGDDISFIAKKDLLIAHYGESYLKSQKRERKEYSCSNRMRELARLLMTYRTSTNNQTVCFKDLLHPQNFDEVVSATRKLAGFDPVNKTYEAPSTALHMGTALKVISDELIHLILKRDPGFSCESTEKLLEWHRDVKNFKKLVEARWNTEISSVANKDLNEKRWKKPLLVPLVNDVKTFREKALEYARECETRFLDNTDTYETYRLFLYCTLALLILFNRRRIGDVQYLKIDDYLSERKTDFQDFESTLSEGEKCLTKHYKRVLNGGKGSRPVVILVPEILQCFINNLLKKRNKYISSENNYVFANPKSTIKWTQGDVAIRYLTKKMKLENAAAITSNKLRKHIATTMQILNMTKSDCKQFSKFMGHTEKTHEEFYELPVDINQTAKVVKLLIMMEKGIPTQYKGKSLSEIELNINEYVDENNQTSSHTITEHADNEPTSSKMSSNKKRELNYTGSESNDEPVVHEPHKPGKIKKQAWSAEEITTLKKHFQKFVEEGYYPSGAEIQKFIKLSKSERTVPVVKAKIQHLISQKKH